MSEHHIHGMMPGSAARKLGLTDTCILLLSRMAVLEIDASEVNDADLLLFREMQGLCTLCRRKARCVLDLQQNDADVSWKEYCPNAATLQSIAV
jgi:hypothetical protein